MSYEVELKFPVPDLEAFSKRLADLAAPIFPAREELDLYFAHPVKDFAQTDEALRLRRKGDENYITYKGPKIDATSKTRREIELPLAPGPESLASWTELLEAVGFRPVGEVRKSRRKAEIPWQGRRVEASLDEVDGAGTFVEFELMAEEIKGEAVLRQFVDRADRELARSRTATARRILAGANGGPKLTEAKRRAIMPDWHNPELTAAQIAQKHVVSRRLLFAKMGPRFPRESADAGPAGS